MKKKFVALILFVFSILVANSETIKYYKYQDYSVMRMFSPTFYEEIELSQTYKYPVYYKVYYEGCKIIGYDEIFSPKPEVNNVIFDGEGNQIVIEDKADISTVDIAIKHRSFQYDEIGRVVKITNDESEYNIKRLSPEVYVCEVDDLFYFLIYSNETLSKPIKLYKKTFIAFCSEYKIIDGKSVGVIYDETEIVYPEKYKGMK